MTELSIESSQTGVILSGDLVTEWVSEALFDRVFCKTETIDLDLSKVERIDTAGLAWLILLFKEAKQRKIHLNIQQAPDALIKLATLSNVESLLGAVDRSA
jgi:phospholipid transport system transporter-binding protein